MEERNHMLQDHSVTQETGMNEDWAGVLDEYGVQFLVLDRHDDSDLLTLFRSLPGWAVDFEDEEAVIFVRADIAQVYNSRARMNGFGDSKRVFPFMQSIIVRRDLRI
ncbi:MAG: hypothetical protein ISS49_17410 [Anaerolineae bacterium]|nr:hypothetical protein [Anaerolineae bacterium]